MHKETTAIFIPSEDIADLGILHEEQHSIDIHEQILGSV